MSVPSALNCPNRSLLETIEGPASFHTTAISYDLQKKTRMGNPALVGRAEIQSNESVSDLTGYLVRDHIIGFVCAFQNRRSNAAD
jgi:hypothetical protein